MRVVHAALIAAVVLAGITCSDRGVVTPELNLPTDFVVSNPKTVAATSSAVGRASISASGQSIVYVSLPPHTLPDAATVLVQTPSGGVVSVPLIHGGFDPVAIAANEGDELKLTITDPNGVSISRTLKVPARRPPTIVRSDPRKGRTDIALNVSVTVVFSEPVDQTTVSSNSVYLLKEGARVNGHTEFVDNSWTVKFVPDKPLAAQSSYELVVTPSIRDLDGDVIEGSYSATFVTGSTVDSPCPGYADPADCPPFPTGGDGSISGVVFERTVDGARPLGNATVFAWIQLSNGSGYARGGTQSDANGRFTVTLLPVGTIVLEGYAPGYDHPCANTINFNGVSAAENIELVPESHPLPDAATAEPRLTGVVYETTPNGREPIPGARVFFDPLGGMGLVAAITTTDEKGRYAFCKAAPGLGGWSQRIDAVKDGYVTNGQDVSVYGPIEVHADIELKRQ